MNSAASLGSPQLSHVDRSLSKKRKQSDRINQIAEADYQDWKNINIMILVNTLSSAEVTTIFSDPREPVIVPAFEPVIVPALDPVMVPARDPVIVPTLDPVIVPTLLVREPVIVPAREALESDRVKVAVATST
jgi:hypothetical protein